MVQWSDYQFYCKQLRARRAKYSENGRKSAFFHANFTRFQAFWGQFSRGFHWQYSAKTRQVIVSSHESVTVTSAESRVKSWVIRLCDSSRVMSHKNVTGVMTRVESPSHESPALLITDRDICKIRKTTHSKSGVADRMVTWPMIRAVTWPTFWKLGQGAAQNVAYLGRGWRYQKNSKRWLIANQGSSIGWSRDQWSRVVT